MMEERPRDLSVMLGKIDEVHREELGASEQRFDTVRMGGGRRYNC